MKRLQRLFSMLLVICFANATMFEVAQAALVSTEQVAGIASASGSDASPHERLSALIARSDVQAEFERLGLSPDLAKERIAALTDEEASMLAQKPLPGMKSEKSPKKKTSKASTLSAATGTADQASML